MFRQRNGAIPAGAGAGTLAEGRWWADICVVRWLIPTLLAAVASTAIFVVVRNNLDLEDSRFIYAMLAFSTLAFGLSAASCLILGSSMRSSSALGVVAFIAVPLLYVAYLALFVVAVCLIGSETCYS
jgi:hypothetical protein